ncbi:4-hydroxythreonine-4-phosphate dehydrogenase PdxA [bacterium]|nr:4-hydroxythreonine-4-phosphate dehydrogenase PdxA [bacterium]
MNRYKDKIAITTGDFNGIGAEITIKALNSLNLPKDEIVLITNQKILDFYGKLNCPYEIINTDFKGEIEPSKITKESGEFSFKSLEKACEIKPKAIVTAPVSKEAMHLAGYNFNGQTEVLEKFLAHDSQKAEMLFIANDFKVLLLTRHIALKDVPKYITEDLIINKVLTVKNFLKKDNPKFALCALNPHAGENGIMGDEEKNTIIPACEKLRSKGIDIINPLPADTLFINGGKNYLNGLPQDYDCYFAMYHDQGLIPIKTIAPKETVNMTIGLDIVRTSPCHGTAFDIAGKNKADFESMISAIKAAQQYA